MDDFDDRNVFLYGGMWEHLVGKTKTRWAILEPLKAPTHDILNTLRVLCGNGEIVAFHTEQPSEVKAEVMSLCRFFVEYDGITKNPYSLRHNNKLCLSLREVFYSADLPDGRQIRHVYPEAKGDSNEPLGSVFIAMVVHRYTDTRHRLVLAPSGGLSAVNFWRKLVKELKRIFDDADCEVRDLTVLGQAHATNYILDEEQEQTQDRIETAAMESIQQRNQKTPIVQESKAGSARSMEQWELLLRKIIEEEPPLPWPVRYIGAPLADLDTAFRRFKFLATVYGVEMRREPDGTDHIVYTIMHGDDVLGTVNLWRLSQYSCDLKVLSTGKNDGIVKECVTGTLHNWLVRNGSDENDYPKYWGSKATVSASNPISDSTEIAAPFLTQDPKDVTDSEAPQTEQQQTKRVIPQQAQATIASAIQGNHAAKKSTGQTHKPQERTRYKATLAKRMMKIRSMGKTEAVIKIMDYTAYQNVETRQDFMEEDVLRKWLRGKTVEAAWDEEASKKAES